MRVTDLTPSVHSSGINSRDPIPVNYIRQEDSIGASQSNKRDMASSPMDSHPDLERRQQHSLPQYDPSSQGEGM